MKHWHIDDVPWERFDPSLVEPDIVPLVKAAAMVERNGDEYALYLNSVFRDDPDFRQAANHWAEEEVQHGDALGRWATLADPSFDYPAAFARYRAGFKINTTADASIRGSRSGELIARCMVEIGTSSYYTALGEATREPVLQHICRLIAADEYRHFKLFYDHLRRYLEREKLTHLQRLRIALGRATESEDDELAFAYHVSNDPPGTPYDHGRCIGSYMVRAMRFYRFHHFDRGMGMMFKAVGLPPRGRLSRAAAHAAYRLVQWRRARYERALQSSSPAQPLARAA
ncbi:MAG: ferritin-like domain-containing protein [Rhodovarius sp.]|nr:ferritin-like domain-containing protein [Rhodovarius sp.]MCX7933407.1 ferritin-like domain-containing protein [Rhodovarius sp.]MDW8315573.1 ferritin-like domain-containing protein [Rhodovarius sp.]